ncbi:uncharacterized protein IL334_005447 [Kwoniella shivajii]|uniref:Rho GDP-dissociation inhibitor n=1 Tax=Kwoniella shivajii TaxID=564305 RepID=A0ABZ1D365_9TREE|nr:hypothetical protein IL334_005447 [Kwoniella shivajii]
MSHPKETTEDELAPTETQGYKVGQSKTVAELAALDQEDESLQRWKASLGLGANANAGGSKRVILKTLFLSSPTLPTTISIDLTQPAADLAKLKAKPFGITFTVENEIVSGLKYLQVVKRAGINVDKTEAMLGSYGPQDPAYTKVFASEESPSGMLARSGNYTVRSRVIDDDKHVWLDFEWTFKLAKEW